MQNAAKRNGVLITVLWFLPVFTQNTEAYLEYKTRRQQKGLTKPDYTRSVKNG